MTAPRPPWAKDNEHHEYLDLQHDQWCPQCVRNQHDDKYWEERGRCLEYWTRRYMETKDDDSL